MPDHRLAVYFILWGFPILGIGLEQVRNCPPLTPHRNVDIFCSISSNGRYANPKVERNNCDRSQSVGTLAKYKCSANHIHLNGSFQNRDIENTLKCDSKGRWIGLKRYETYRCKEDCGRLVKNAKPLVINGVSTNRTQWPWHATIFRKEGKVWNYICGGSIVRNQIVISAAHCVAVDHSRVRSPNEFRVILGSISSNYYENLKEKGAQLHKVQRIRISDNYDPKQGYQADLAVIQLKENIEFSENILPVCLPNDYNTDINAIKPGLVGQIAGFGVTEDGEVSPTLRSLDLRIKSNAECYSGLQRKLSDSQFCGGEKKDGRWETVCNGDSGGGLCVSSKVHQKYYIHGVVSSGDPDTEASVCQNYAVFTRVYPFIFWIRDVIEEISGEIARELHQNAPYPFALRGTETQMAGFYGLPREWYNRVTSIEVLYASFKPETMLNALVNAKPIHSITLRNVNLLSRYNFKGYVVLPVLSSFTLDILPTDPRFERLTEDRTFPIRITESYLRSLLFFDKDFETGENWRAESLTMLNTNIELVVHIFRILRIRIKSGELVMQQTRLADKIIGNHAQNLDFTMRKLALHRCNLNLMRLGAIPTLTKLVLDEVYLNSRTPVQDLSPVLKNLTALKILVLKPVLHNRVKEFKMDLRFLSPKIVHFSVSNVTVGVSRVRMPFLNLNTLCCFDCNFETALLQNFEKIFPKLTFVVMKTTKAMVDLPEFPQLNSRLPMSKFILFQRKAQSDWTFRIPNLREQQNLEYNCNLQHHFWSSQLDYLFLRRLKSFEIRALQTNVFKFTGASLPYTLEEFRGVPASIQKNLKAIHLTAVEVTPRVLADSIAHASQLQSLTLSDITLDINSFKYEQIRNQTLQFNLEFTQFKEFKFQYVQELMNGELEAVVIPYQLIDPFKMGNPSNILHYLFRHINAVRVSPTNCINYVLDTSLKDAKAFFTFVLRVVDMLPAGHVLKGMSDVLYERAATFQDGVIPSSWKFRGLHVLSQDLLKGFFQDDLLRVLRRTGLVDFLLTKLGRFVTIERSTSLTLLKKDKNPLSFPLLHAISASLNEEKIE